MEVGDRFKIKDDYTDCFRNVTSGETYEVLYVAVPSEELFRKYSNVYKGIYFLNDVEECELAMEICFEPI